MSILLQIAIPALVTVAALVAIAIWRKYCKPETVIITVLLLAMGVSLLTLEPPEGAVPPEAADTQATGSNYVSLVLAEEYLLQGEYEAAGTILQELDRTCADDPDVQLTRARMAMLTGDYATAVTMYQLSNKASQELESAQALLQGTGVNNDAIITYLTQQGRNPSDYGLTASDDGTQVDADQVREDILDAIREKKDASRDKKSKNTISAVECAVELTREFRVMVSDYYYDLDTIDDLTDDLCELMEKTEELDCNPYLREARMKGYVAQGKYEQIAETAGAYSTPRELVVMTELLVSDLVDRKDFSDEYSEIDRSKAKEMIRHCEDVLDSNKKTLSEEQYDRYKARIEQFEARVDDPVLFSLQSALSSGAYGGIQTMRSKLFLALAKLEYLQGNEADADSYLADALGTSGDSDDEKYRVPMSQLAAVIQGTADAEAIKNVAAYVDQALDHSTCEDITTELLQSGRDEDPDDPEEPGKDFGDHMEGSVMTAQAMLNIGVIDKSGFPYIEARVQIQSKRWDRLEDIKKYLQVRDCGSTIESFELEKLEFQRARIVLLCDVSGSMSGNEQALRDAIVAFAANMVEGEEVSVIVFSGSIEFQTPFSDDPEEVASYAEKISTGGGTALYQSALTTLQQFTPDINSNDIVIAMTDGQDGYSASDSDMYNVLGAEAANRGVTVYTMGLGGSVDIRYLETMADSCNGSFLYAKDTETMNEFYAFIHGQLNNQYVLKYTAKNQTRNERTLELQMQDELGSATKIYYLQDPSYGDTDGDSYDPYIAVDGELSIYGFATKFLYKSTADQEIKLVGSGFDSGDDVEIRLKGNVEYDLKPTFVDGSTYTLVIPANVATGVYDLSVTIRGESVELEKELTIAAYGTQKHFQFGSYNFTALESHVDENGYTVLSGNVAMNGWLLFKGDVTIMGDYTNSDRVRILDESGAVVSYNVSDGGLAGYLAEQGVPLSIPALGDFVIYNTPYDPAKYEEFPVDTVSQVNTINALLLLFDKARINVYPDMLRMEDQVYQFNLPLQKQLLRNFVPDKNKKLDANIDILVHATDIALTGPVKYKDNGKGYSDLTLVSFPLYVSDATFDLDTLYNNYKLEAEVKIKSLKDSGTLKASFGVKDGKFDSIGLGAEHDKLSITLLTAPVPVSMSNFGFELSGFSEKSAGNVLADVLSKEVVIKFQVDAASLNQYVPAIDELVDGENIALASLENCELTLALKDFRLAFEADVTLVTVLEVGKCEIELGKFDYTNALIGYYDETQYGLRAKLTLGSTWKTDDLMLELEGAAELTIGYPYSGLWLTGDMGFDIDWWIVDVGWDVDGDALIGIYENSSGNAQFSIIVRGTNSQGAHKGFHLYITRAQGFQISKYK